MNGRSCRGEPLPAAASGPARQRRRLASRGTTTVTASTWPSRVRPGPEPAVGAEEIREVEGGHVPASPRARHSAASRGGPAPERKDQDQPAPEKPLPGLGDDGGMGHRLDHPGDQGDRRDQPAEDRARPVHPEIAAPPEQERGHRQQQAGGVDLERQPDARRRAGRRARTGRARAGRERSTGGSRRTGRGSSGSRGTRRSRAARGSASRGGRAAPARRGRGCA